MDIVTNDMDASKKYEIVAAVVLEDKVLLGWEEDEHALLHLFGIREGFERKKHPQILLYHLASHYKLSGRPMYFVSRWKSQSHVVRSSATTEEDDKPITPESIFKSLSFVYKKETCIDELVEGAQTKVPTSKYMFGHGSQIRQIFENFVTADESSYRICKLQGSNFLYCKFDKAGQFQLYTHAYQWRPAHKNELGYIDSKAKNWCKTEDNVDKPYQMSGGGYRERNDMDTLADLDKRGLLREEFQVDNERFVNCCAWLAAVLLINVDDEKVATHMLDLLKPESEEPLQDFEWMCFTKDPRKTRKILIERLQKKDIKYDLKKVQYVGKKRSYLRTILDEDTKGQYLCQLQTSNSTKRYVIGVYCNKKLIFDSCEKYALDLTRKNLDYCCGENSATLKRIVYCYELTKQKI